MISEQRIKEVESKSYDSLTEEEKLIWQYWNSYRESNLWYNMMKEAQSPTASLNYAKKGKDCVLKTLNIQCSIMKIWNSDLYKIQDAGFEDDNAILQKTFETEVQTITYIAQPRREALTPEDVVKFIDETAKATHGKVIIPSRDKLEKVKDPLKARGLQVAEDASDKTKIDINLKILDNLFWTGKIDKKLYDKKVVELTAKKRNIA
jgi:hypothetical protein